MKKFLKYTLIIGFMFLINLSADASKKYKHHWNWGPDKGGICETGGNTTAPLDGGLLTILAAAGISYYVIRKKKKSKV